MMNTRDSINTAAARRPFRGFPFRYGMLVFVFGLLLGSARLNANEPAVAVTTDPKSVGADEHRAEAALPLIQPATPILEQEELAQESPILLSDVEGELADEIWMVSSRQVGCPSDDLAGLRYYLRQDEQWQERPADEFTQGLGEPRLNILFVHGNRTDLQWASRRGLQAYESFVRSQNPGTPIRYIIWAWPSDQVAGPLADFRIKAQRANMEGHLFGTFLTRFPRDRQISLVAYSYGSRIVLGGLQLLAGETLFGRRLELPDGFVPPPMRVTLIAAAAGNSSLVPRATYGQAYPLMERLLLVNNTADRALKLYRWLDRGSKISALGRGIAGRSLLEDGGERIEQFDFAREIGHEHSLLGYFRSSRIRSLVKQQVFWIDHEAEPAAIADSRSASR